MSIWISFFDLADDEPLGNPYEIDYPNEGLQPAAGTSLDLARPMGGFPQGWVRVIVGDAPSVETGIMLSPAQTRALYDALGALIDGEARHD